MLLALGMPEELCSVSDAEIRAITLPERVGGARVDHVTAGSAMGHERERHPAAA